jgi:hypothetical protein
MKNNLHKNLGNNEIYYLELAKRTKDYVLNFFINTLIGRYTVDLSKVSDLLWKYYKVLIVLEPEEEFEDLIEGVYQLYVEAQNFQDE